MSRREATLIARKIQKNSRSTALASVCHSCLSTSVSDGRRPSTEMGSGHREVRAAASVLESRRRRPDELGVLVHTAPAVDGSPKAGGVCPAPWTGQRACSMHAVWKTGLAGRGQTICHSQKGRGYGHVTRFKFSPSPPKISLEWLKLEASNSVHWLAV